MSGRRFDPEAPEFAMLSPGLKQDIQHRIYLPLVERVHFFGHNESDKLESIRCKKEFDRIAATGSAGMDKLDKQDMRTFLERLKIDVSDDEYEQVFSELDRHDAGYIAYGEFHRWCACIQLTSSRIHIRIRLWSVLTDCGFAVVSGGFSRRRGDHWDSPSRTKL